MDMDARTVLGTCHHDCPDTCGWVATVEAGVAVKLRGNPEHPYSRGELCPKVNRYLDRVYSPDRILTPLVRVGHKGEGRFEPVSWDEALARVSARFHEILDHHGGEAILPWWDAGTQGLLQMSSLDRRLFARLGAARLTGSLCGATAGFGTAATNGTARAGDPTDVRFSPSGDPVGHQHEAHQPPPVALRRRGPGEGRDRRRDRPRPDRHGRRRGLVRATAARHRRRPDAGDDARAGAGRPRRCRLPRRVRARLRGPGGARGRVDAGACRGHLRTRGRRDRTAGAGLRHHPPGDDQDAHRGRAPRARRDVLPVPGLPPGVDRRLARSGRRPGPQCGFLERGERRRLGLRGGRLGRWSPAPEHQHEPPGSGADRARAAGHGPGGVERQPAGDGAQRRPHEAGPGA